jgi:RHS repeat-associated protein
VDRTGGLTQVLAEVTTENAIRVFYVRGDDLISQWRVDGNSETVSYYGYDGHGSTVILVNSSGTATDHWFYDAWGNIVTREGSGTPNTYLYTGQQQDGTGLYYLRARYYHPQSGRFGQRDPFGGFDQEPATLHKYAYCRDCPTSGTDPSGLMTLGEMGISVLISTALGALIGGAIGGVRAGWGGMLAGALSGAAFGFLIGVGAVSAGYLTAALTAYAFSQGVGAFGLLVTALGIPSVLEELAGARSARDRVAAWMGLVLLAMGGASATMGFYGWLPSWGGRTITQYDFFGATHGKFRDVSRRVAQGTIPGNMFHHTAESELQADLGHLGVAVEACFSRDTGLLERVGATRQPSPGGTYAYDAILMRPGRALAPGVTHVRDIWIAADFKPTSGADIGRFADIGWPVPFEVAP